MTMKEYMINIKLPQQLKENFVALIPKQRAQVNKLMEEGKIIQYALAADRSMLWVTMIAKSEREVMDILSTLPLIHYMNPIACRFYAVEVVRKLASIIMYKDFETARCEQLLPQTSAAPEYDIVAYAHDMMDGPGEGHAIRSAMRGLLEHLG